MKESGAILQLIKRTMDVDEKFNTIDDGVTLTYENVIFPHLVIVVGIIIAICLSALENSWVKARDNFFKKQVPSRRVAFGQSA